MVIQAHTVVGGADCWRLMALYNRYADQATRKDESGFPVVYWPAFSGDDGAAELVRSMVDECLKHIARHLGAAELIYPETIILATMGVGGRHSRHADNCRQNADGSWVPNHTPHRDVSAVFYLNDEFEGGEIVFEKLGLIIRPQAGLMVAFPSDAEHVHEVKPVRCGARYTMPIWFTKQERRALSIVRP